METLQNKTVYRCSLCNKLSLSKGAMAVHEHSCAIKHEFTSSPCFECQFYNKALFTCQKTNNKMYYARKVLLMRDKQKKNWIMNNCDCRMPKFGECEYVSRYRRLIGSALNF